MLAFCLFCLSLCYFFPRFFLFLVILSFYGVNVQRQREPVRAFLSSCPNARGGAQRWEQLFFLVDWEVATSTMCLRGPLRRKEAQTPHHKSVIPVTCTLGRAFSLLCLTNPTLCLVQTCFPQQRDGHHVLHRRRCRTEENGGELGQNLAVMDYARKCAPSLAGTLPLNDGFGLGTIAISDPCQPTIERSCGEREALLATHIIYYQYHTALYCIKRTYRMPDSPE